MIIVQSVVWLGKGFGMSITAEGVETEAQRERLCSERCSEGQGYLFARPMSAQQFSDAYGLGTLRKASAA